MPSACNDVTVARMLATTETESAATAAENWLAQFEKALAEPDDVLLKTLFHADSYWRDVLALTWRIKTVAGADAILSELKAHVGRARPAGFRIAPNRTPPRHVTRAGSNAIEAIFRSSTQTPVNAGRAPAAIPASASISINKASSQRR